eukprot:1619421-Alexandrium_andersonii.AAC.1
MSHAQIEKRGRPHSEQSSSRPSSYMQSRRLVESPLRGDVGDEAEEGGDVRKVLAATRWLRETAANSFKSALGRNEQGASIFNTSSSSSLGRMMSTLGSAREQHSHEVNEGSARRVLDATRWLRDTAESTLKSPS